MASAGLPDKVTLITPPSIFLLDERVFVNLGILKVAAVLEKQGVFVEHLDLSGTENYLDALETHLRAAAPGAIGITTTTPQLPTVAKIAGLIRAVRPEARIILGGPHVTLTDSAVKLERRQGRVSRAHAALARLEALADVLVSGDGEFAVLVALRPDAPTLVDGDDPSGDLFLTNAAYEEMPFPARHLVDIDSYHYEIEGRRSTSLIAQLGCPFGCGFCGGRNTKSLRMIRTRSTASIVAEVRALYHAHGFTGFMFYDDELNVNKNMVGLMNALADLQSELGQDFRFRGFVKAELFTVEQAAAMYRAGFRWLLCGFESGSPRILENVNKRAALDDNSRAVDLAKEAGLKVKALMSVGHPGESEQTTRETQEWLLRARPEDGRADPHHGGPLLDGHLEVVAHAHGEVVHAEAGNAGGHRRVAQLPEPPEVRADILGVFQEWRDGHQAQDLEPRQGRGLPKERHQVRLGEPRFRQLAALVHLDEARYSLAQGPGVLVQLVGQLQGIQGVNEVEELNGELGLVRL